MTHTQRNIDFTRGNIVGSIVAFSMPIVLGELLQNLYNSVDAIVVGNFAGKNALAAVTVGGVISNMVVMFFNGMSVGANVTISKAYGHGDAEELRAKVRIAFTFSLLLGVGFSLLGILFTPQLLELAGTQAEYYTDALTYLRIYLAGLMFTVIYNNAAGILRAVGDSRTPFRILVLACGVNIVMDVALTGVLRLGVTGVALATVFSQALSTALAYRAIGRSQGTHCIDLGELFREGGATVREILGVGMAAGLQSALIGLSNIFVTRYMNLFSTASVAGIGIAQRIDRFVILPAKSFGITMTTFVSQNLGAERDERVRSGVKQCLLAALVVTLSLSALVYVFARSCVALFNPEPEVVGVGVDMVRVLALMFWVMAVREVLLGYLRGYGRSFLPMVLSLIGMIGVRQVYLAVTLHTAQPEIVHIYRCYPIAWAATTLLLLVYFLLVRKKLSRRRADLD
ncbi:MAG: MATE family efflux transporter [Oscillospiraceae bacterium]|nr:MATE family efflux transporter [Oscillospiraceae bacterium]